MLLTLRLLYCFGIDVGVEVRLVILLRATVRLVLRHISCCSWVNVFHSSLGIRVITGAICMVVGLLAPVAITREDLYCRCIVLSPCSNVIWRRSSIQSSYVLFLLICRFVFSDSNAGSMIACRNLYFFILGLYVSPASSSSSRASSKSEMKASAPPGVSRAKRSDSNVVIAFVPVLCLFALLSYQFIRYNHAPLPSRFFWYFLTYVRPSPFAVAYFNAANRCAFLNVCSTYFHTIW